MALLPFACLSTLSTVLHQYHLFTHKLTLRMSFHKSLVSLCLLDFMSKPFHPVAYRHICKIM